MQQVHDGHFNVISDHQGVMQPQQNGVKAVEYIVFRIFREFEVLCSSMTTCYDSLGTCTL